MTVGIKTYRKRESGTLKRDIFVILSTLVLTSLLLSGCGDSCKSNDPRPHCQAPSKILESDKKTDQMIHEADEKLDETATDLDQAIETSDEASDNAIRKADEGFNSGTNSFFQWVGQTGSELNAFFGVNP